MAKYKSGIQTKHHIYEAAELLFYEKGYQTTSIADINELSQTNKSSFYHHYESKLQIGTEIYGNFSRNNTTTATLFASSIDNITGVCMDLKTFWYLFYADEKIRRFSIDLAADNVLKIADKSYIFDVCFDLSEKGYSEYEKNIIKMASVGLTKQFNLDAYTVSDNFDDVSDYFFRFLLRLFDIERHAIEKILEYTKSLLQLCVIANEGFVVKSRLK
ncbi:MAG: TetR/AcrR family transcriptional regulator [Eubacteriaceae bacterium]|jgi:AcrR family transcriptional regulator|nr:TetR/AcrR family transcriptional regulator [Eubacteriaceae bacterium]